MLQARHPRDVIMQMSWIVVVYEKAGTVLDKVKEEDRKSKVDFAVNSIMGSFCNRYSIPYIFV